jgi:membrane complex biogenesis BtpA family protein
MVHLLALPGAPRYERSMAQILDKALEEAAILAGEGVHGILVENYGDIPFWGEKVPAETVAAMAVVVREIAKAHSVLVGVNVLRNDAESALAVAVATDAHFIRVNVHTGTMFSDQGMLEGKAAHTLRKREALGHPVHILADVLVKHATPPPGLTLEEAARDTWLRGMADGLVVSGRETGEPVDPDALTRLRHTLPDLAKVWVGSGVTKETVAEMAQEADGIIVGSALQAFGMAGTMVERPRVRAFMDAFDGR